MSKKKTKSVEYKTGTSKAFDRAFAAVPSTDTVTRPDHYTQGKIECIDAIDVVTDDMTGPYAFLSGTVLKYVWRWYRKNGVEDLKKARWYLNRLILKLDPTDKGV